MKPEANRQAMYLNHQISLFYCFLIVLIGMEICHTQQDPNPIKLENGAYGTILIAIHKDIEEDPRIIENIKEIFREGSSVLFSATNRKFYFGTIKILVPHNWTRQPEYEVAQLEAYENANVIVTDQQSNHRPHVQNPFYCGQEGLFIQLSKTFLIDPVLRQNQFGDSGKVIVRQFAKLRWGVFDEDYVPGTGADPYYPSNAITAYKGFEGTRCSEKVKGKFVNDNGHLCGLDPSTDLLEPSCKFVPDTVGQDAKASLMFASNIDSIDTFCDIKADDEGRRHNKMAPNLQNWNCDGQSVWEVIRKSDDWKEYGNRPPLPEDTETSPNFIVVQPGGILRVVLVLDTSGSMDGERFEKMIKGAKNFINSIVPDNSYVGIVEFNFKSEVDSNMTKLTNATSRDEMNSRLPTFANGATCIGCGILGGIEVAQYNGMDSRGTYLILLSDGEENEEPLIADTLDDIKNSSVIIHTIAFFEADTQMEELAQMTGGSSYTCPDGGSAQCVISAFVSIIATRPQSIPEAPRQVESKTVKVDPGSIETTTIMIDASLGLDTIMTFTWSANSIITISVTGPDGTSIESTDPEYNIDISSKIITISIDVAEPGEWIILIVNIHTLVEEVSVDVNSKQRSKDVYPPVVSSFLGAKIVNYTSFPLVEVYAYVHTNYQPVIDATVIATVESTLTGNETVIKLQDNGMGADLITGDGIYSAYFLDFSSNGRYGVKVDVNGITTSSSNNTLLRSKRAAGTPTTPRPPQGFQLTTTAGVFQVENYSPDLNIDILAPAKITDFTSVERTYDENRNVTLTWMAVGDDLDQGTAASYELRFSDNFTEIRTNFTSAPAITDTDLIVGNLSQVASSGNLESISFLLPGEDSDAIFYFMIRAWDEAGNAGPLSNIMSVSRRRLPPTTLPTTDLTSEAASNAPSSTGILTSKLISTQSPGNPEEPFPLWAIITFSLLGIILLITIPIIIRVVCCRPKSMRVTGPHNDHMNPMYDGP